MRTRAVFVGILIGSLVACGGGGGDDDGGASGVGDDDETATTVEAAGGGSGAGGGADSCRFVTSDEAAALLSEDVGEPTQVETPEVGDVNAAAACTYRGTSPSAGIQIVSSTVDDPAEFLPDDNALDAGAETLPGVGDAAYIIEGGFSTVAVRVGSDMVLIFPSRAAGDITRDELVELGRKAAERM